MEVADAADVAGISSSLPDWSVLISTACEFSTSARSSSSWIVTSSSLHSSAQIPCTAFSSSSGLIRPFLHEVGTHEVNIPTIYLFLSITLANRYRRKFSPAMKCLSFPHCDEIRDLWWVSELQVQSKCSRTQTPFLKQPKLTTNYLYHSLYQQYVSRQFRVGMISSSCVQSQHGTRENNVGLTSHGEIRQRQATSGTALSENYANASERDTLHLACTYITKKFSSTKPTEMGPLF